MRTKGFRADKAAQTGTNSNPDREPTRPKSCSAGDLRPSEDLRRVADCTRWGAQYLGHASKQPEWSEWSEWSGLHGVLANES